MSKKQEKKELLKEDQVVATLEKGQYWLEENYKWIILLVVAVMAGAAASYWRTSSAAEHQAELWDRSSKLKTMDERRAFLEAYPKDEASVLLYLVLARQELDEKMPDKAVQRTKKFLEFFPGHALTDIAYTLQAYGCEDLGRKEDAVQAYKLASEKGSFAAKELSEMAIARLGVQ